MPITSMVSIQGTESRRSKEWCILRQERRRAEEGKVSLSRRRKRRWRNMTRSLRNREREREGRKEKSPRSFARKTMRRGRREETANFFVFPAQWPDRKIFLRQRTSVISNNSWDHPRYLNKLIISPPCGTQKLVGKSATKTSSPRRMLLYNVK